VQDYPGLWWSACSWSSHSVPNIISQHICVLVEGLGEKPSSSASVFFSLPSNFVIKILANSSPKTGKLVKFTQGKKKNSQIFRQKRYKICWKISALYL
jgi:hypothetical protein